MPQLLNQALEVMLEAVIAVLIRLQDALVIAGIHRHFTSNYSVSEAVHKTTHIEGSTFPRAPSQLSWASLITNVSFPNPLLEWFAAELSGEAVGPVSRNSSSRQWALPL